MRKKERDINGKLIGNAIGYCHSEAHKGALNRELANRHKCLAKHCDKLEKYDEASWRKKETCRKKK